MSLRRREIVERRGASPPIWADVRAPSCAVVKPCSSVEVSAVIWLVDSAAICDVVNASACVVVRLAIVVVVRPAICAVDSLATFKASSEVVDIVFSYVAAKACA